MAKLVEILARELKEWPENFPHAYLSQSVSGRVAYVINNKERVSVGNFDKADDWLDALVDKREWQAAVDALKAKEVIEWDGVGLPPDGTICELRNVAAGTEWATATVVFASRNVVVWEWDGEPAINGLCTAYKHAVEMRPVRTPEQIAAEEREAEVNRMVATVSMLDKGWARKVCYALYDNNYRKQEPK